MISKKPAASKRAPLPGAADYARTFRKDWQRLPHSGRYDTKRLKEAMLLLIAGDAPLGPEWLDHPLKDDWADHRECHIDGDFLLIYQLEGDKLNFVRAGSHADLFGCA
ncbi:MAG: type II toxin-antitoxin system YafQ family toxin [Candidatus Accumulibacter sp.]|jgi:mRNA interferase YafQ|nr:type II toxin-antitoxin system YafQ family toxin [Accumulibacter sp.]